MPGNALCPAHMWGTGLMALQRWSLATFRPCPGVPEPKELRPRSGVHPIVSLLLKAPFCREGNGDSELREDRLLGHSPRARASQPLIRTGDKS